MRSSSSLPVGPGGPPSPAPHAEGISSHNSCTTRARSLTLTCKTQEAEQRSLLVRSLSEATIKMIPIANREAGAEFLLLGAAKG